MFKKHIFICNNKRDPSVNRKSCGEAGNLIRIALAKRLHDDGLSGSIRANKCGCLDGCELGPVMVIYPQNIWYGNIKLDNVHEIYERSILKDDIIQRLLIKPHDWEHRK